MLLIELLKLDLKLLEIGLACLHDRVKRVTMEILQLGLTALSSGSEEKGNS